MSVERAGPGGRPSGPVAIVGAGMAGLACATALRRAGVAVRVFEKSRGAGGRMSTRRGEGWACDSGAQYFTARHPDFVAELARWRAAGATGEWRPRLLALAGASLREPDPTVRRYVGTPGMSAPGRFMAGDLAPATQTTIDAIERVDRGWRLAGREAGPLEGTFAAVVLAIPAPQAAALLRAPAPKLAGLAAGVPMRGCWALMARYDAALATPFDAAFVNEGPLSWVARDSGKPGRGGPETWLLHASASWSEAHLEDDAEGVAAAMLGAFGHVGGGAVPRAWTAHRWRYALADPPLEVGCAWDAALGIGLCGDWLNGGRVEGAWLSGRALAAAILPGR